MEFIILATAHFLALLSPGPDFFLIVQSALRMKMRYSVAICAGIAIANGAYLTCALLGIEIIKNSTWLMKILQYSGACYLIFLGFMLIKAQQATGEDTKESKFFLQVDSLYKQFTIGFLSGILNPKNMLFYFSIFTVLVSEETTFTIRCFYALWMMSIVFIWDCLIAIFLGREKIQRFFAGTIFYVEKVTGATLAFFGISLIFF